MRVPPAPPIAPIYPSPRQGKQVNPPRPTAENRSVPPEFGPDDTLSPTEAHAWRILERRLRIDLPVRRIERRARVRTDRVLRLAVGGLLGGLVLTLLARYSPELLVAIGVCVAAAGLAGACVRLVTLARLGRAQPPGNRRGRPPRPGPPASRRSR